MSEHPNLTVVDHPLVRHKLSILRSVDTSIRLFRDLAEEITALMAFAATLDLREEPYEVQTPLESMTGSRLTGKKPAIFPILRAGLGMVPGMLQVMPGARVGHVGLARNEETLQPEEYYFKAPPDLDKRAVIVVDPMLATGGSAVAALTGLKARGARDLRLVCLVAAPEGVRVLHEAHPDVHVYAAALDRQLNEIGYIVPGLGDAGDRLMGTD